MSDRDAVEQHRAVWQRVAERRAILDRLYRQNEFKMKFGLEAMRAALDELGHPHRTAPHTLVAGTNGKGSTSSLLAHLLTVAGLTCGHFSSPHLCDFGERFRVGGDALPDAAWLPVARDILARFAGAPFVGGEASPAGPLEPRLTFFELASAIAVRVLSERARHVVYEVGLGGRLDATNALEPVVCVVTRIALDHTRWLGDTIPEVAAEKGAIARPGAPLVIGSRTGVPTLLACARARGADARLIGRDFEIVQTTVGWCYRDGEGWEIQLDGVELESYQRDNVASAIAALHALSALGHVAEDAALHAVQEGLPTWHWPGRLQTLEIRDVLGDDVPNAALLLDAAHNPDGAGALADVLRKRGGRLALVTNGMADKDVEATFGALSALISSDCVLVPPIFSNRALKPDVYCARCGLPPTCVATNIIEALTEAAHLAGAQGCVVATGSLYLLGEILALAPPARWQRASRKRASRQRPPDDGEDEMSDDDGRDGDIQYAKRELIKLGLDKGNVTKGEIAEHLPLDHMSEVELDVLTFTFKSLGIAVVDS